MFLFLTITASLGFIAASIGYWMVSHPLNSLPTYEDLRVLEELDKKNTAIKTKNTE